MARFTVYKSGLFFSLITVYIISKY